MNNYLIQNISWRGNLESGFSQKMNLVQGAELKELPLDSYNFNFQLSEKRLCPGFISKKGYQFCRVNSELREKQTLCGYCEKIQGFKSSFLFGEEPNENAKEIMESNHYIYLAYFPNGVIKVGTAVESRKYLRPIEQDAYACLLIAKSTGYTIQNLEHSISSKLNITEFVKSEVKYKNILNEINFEIAQKALLDMHSKIKKVLGGGDFSRWFLEDKELIVKNLSEHLFIPDREIVKIDDRNVVGKFKGVRGRYLILENDLYQDLYLVFDVKDLVGREIENETQDYRYNLHQQFTLGL